MEIISSCEKMQELAKTWQKEGFVVGLVPTMGYLHEGHLSLAQAARKKCDIVVMSIFVNPTQFGPNEDFAVYPRDLAHDTKLAQSVGVDYIFHPQAEDMYPEHYSTYVQVEGLTETLCGKARPGHFRGVTTVVSKLFHLVLPQMAFFGQKDGQQVAVVERMVKDLNFPVTIVRVPIQRQSDGLALSSRNIYLSEEEKKQATVLSRSLRMAQKAAQNGEKNAAALKELIYQEISRQDLAKIEYVEIVDAVTMQPVTELKEQVMIALAVRFGKTRLIDNIMIPQNCED